MGACRRRSAPTILTRCWLLPPSVREWVPEGDLAHVISDVVDVLDLSEIEAVYEEELRGYPPYHPRMMTQLWLYAYAVGIRSCRKLSQLVQRDVGFMMLAAGNQPDFRTLNSFRLRHLAALSRLFVQVVRLCEKRGLVQLRHVAVDGTRVKANASKHSAMSYGRMKQEEARIRAEVEAYFQECDRVDAEEDERYGPDRRGDELPEELRTAERRRRAIREAMAELEREAQEAGKAEPEEKAQRNFTDPESRIMKGSEGAFIQGYNAQAAVDACSQVIVAAGLTNSAADAGQLVPLVDRVEANLGVRPRQVSADAGYCSETNLEALEERGIDGYVATGRMSRSYRCPPGTPRADSPGPDPAGADAAAADDQARPGHLPAAAAGGGAGVRPDPQQGADPVMAAGRDQGARRVAPPLHRPQPVQAPAGVDMRRRR